MIPVEYQRALKLIRGLKLMIKRTQESHLPPSQKELHIKNYEANLWDLEVSVKEYQLRTKYFSEIK